MCEGRGSAAEPPGSDSAMLRWGLGAGWAWHKMPKIVPLLVCKESCCVTVGCSRACGPSGLRTEPPAGSADFCFPSLDTVCLFLVRESLWHRNLRPFYQHKMRLITPSKGSASAELQHQVLSQKSLSRWQTPRERGRGVYCGCLPAQRVPEDASARGKSPKPL